MAPSLRLTIVDPANLPLHERTRSVTQGPFRIGRVDDNDWVIEDPARLMSRHHCTIDLKAGVFVVIDTSVNGLFVNSAEQPLGRGNSVILNDGDLLHLASVTLQASLQDAEAQRDPFLAILPGAAGSRPAPRPPADDPFAEAPQIGGSPAFTPYSPTSLLPWTEDPPAHLPDPLFATSPWQNATESDHVPAELQALGAVTPVNTHIPESWEEEVLGTPARQSPGFGAPIPPFDDPAPPFGGARPPATEDAPALPRATVLALVEALARISEAADAQGAEDIFAGTAEEAVARLAALDPEWAGLSLVSLSVRISGQLRADRDFSRGPAQHAQSPADAWEPPDPEAPYRRPFDGDDTR
ncbi:FHA domain-containing protein [Roseixanthobacter glucoisosaccharinicivorans]|uniref:FHA domain-containing protein n=1 Tax=Roseixanthobacter glucoisosaccharinicivorans TaxID=3119923 RepID=UPI00372A177D